MKKKAPSRKHDKPLQVRVFGELLKLYREAAEASGLSLSGWVRDRLTKAARKELK